MFTVTLSSTVLLTKPCRPILLFRWAIRHGRNWKLYTFSWQPFVYRQWLFQTVILLIIHMSASTDVDTWYLLLELSDDLYWRHNNLCGTHCLSKDNYSSLPKYLRRGIAIHKMTTCGASDEVGWWHAIDWCCDNDRICCDNDRIYFAGPERHNHQFYDTTE